MGERKLSITLPDDMADAIKARVDSGRYNSQNDVMRAAVTALLREEDDQDGRLDAIRERVRKSIEDPRPQSDRRRSPHTSRRSLCPTQGLILGETCSG